MSRAILAASRVAIVCGSLKRSGTVMTASWIGWPTASTLLLGQVVGVPIDPAFLKNGLFDVAAAGTVARCGYRGDYAEVTSLFEMLRPAP